MGINLKCSVFMAEVTAIAVTSKIYEQQKEDILVLTDSKSECEAIRNTRLSAQVMTAILNMKERVAAMEKNIKSKGERRRVIIG